jgi:hypothetical protein
MNPPPFDSWGEFKPRRPKNDIADFLMTSLGLVSCAIGATLLLDPELLPPELSARIKAPGVDRSSIPWAFIAAGLFGSARMWSPFVANIIAALPISSGQKEESQPPQPGYLELAGRHVYWNRAWLGATGVMGGLYWIEKSSSYVGFGLLILGGISLIDGLATWIRVRMHLYCGTAAEAAEVANFWKVEEREPPTDGRKPFNLERLDPSLERASEGAIEWLGKR